MSPPSLQHALLVVTVATMTYMHWASSCRGLGYHLHDKWKALTGADAMAIIQSNLYRFGGMS